jgi:purine-binding chemotaxis protein CheW
MLDFSEPVVVARVEGTLLAIPSRWAMDMIVCPPVSPLPMAPPGVRGVAIRRDRTVTLVDVRTRLGIATRAEETAAIVELLHAREADHVRWLDTLLECLREGKPFPLARDPHACAFGQWFDRYVPPTLTLSYQLAKFREPHERIHALAAEAEALAATRGADEALSLLRMHQTSTLMRMRNLFAETRRLITEDLRELAITHDTGTALVGLIVDSIESVERLRPETLEPLTDLMAGNPIVRQTARTQRDAVVMIPDLDALVGDLVQGAGGGGCSAAAGTTAQAA